MNEQNTNPVSDQDESLSFGLQVLSFCIPLAGAIIYFTNKDKSPKKAQTACYAALIGFGIGLVINILSYIVAGS
ncbi:MAG: hypothetical protein ACO1PI_14990 [Bacteroidota bacterium]|jgi:hypothetical protein